MADPQFRSANVSINYWFLSDGCDFSLGEAIDFAYGL